MKLRIAKSISILLISQLVLSFAFFYFGEFSVLFFGATLFLLLGYYPFFEKKYFWEIILYLIVIVLFFGIIFYHFKISVGLSSLKSTGFLLFLVSFSLSFFVGRSIKVLIKNINLREILFYSLLALLLARLSIFFGKPASTAITGLIYIGVSFFLFRSNQLSKWVIFLSLIASYLLFFGILSPIKEEVIAVSFFVFCSILTSFWLSEPKLKFKRIIVLGYLVFVGFYTVLVMNLREYLYTRNDKLPQVEYSDSFIKIDSSDISTEDFSGKVVVLDLWTTSCKVCFEKFPDFEKFYLDNQGRSDIIIYSVNLPENNQEIEVIYGVINKLDYKFPILISKKSYNFYNEMYNINGVPSIMVLNKNGKMVYNSNFNNNPFVLVNNLQNLVDKLAEKVE